MSLPNIPDITPQIDLKREDMVNLLLASVALEEIGMGHLLNAEAEKLQKVIQSAACGESHLQNLLQLNESVERTVNALNRMQMLLQAKMENILRLVPPKSSCTHTSTGTCTSTHTHTSTCTATCTTTGSCTHTSTCTCTATSTHTHTSTCTATSTHTHTSTCTATGSCTHTSTGTCTATSTHTHTSTCTATDTTTSSCTHTSTHTHTSTCTTTGTRTNTSTTTGTHTSTRTHTSTATQTHTSTCTEPRRCTETFAGACLDAAPPASCPPSGEARSRAVTGYGNGVAEETGGSSVQGVVSLNLDTAFDMSKKRDNALLFSLDGVWASGTPVRIILESISGQVLATLLPEHGPGAAEILVTGAGILSGSGFDYCGYRCKTSFSLLLKQTPSGWQSQIRFSLPCGRPYDSGTVCMPASAFALLDSARTRG